MAALVQERKVLVSLVPRMVRTVQEYDGFFLIPKAGDDEYHFKSMDEVIQYFRSQGYPVIGEM